MQHDKQYGSCPSRPSVLPGIEERTPRRDAFSLGYRNLDRVCALPDEESLRPETVPRMWRPGAWSQVVEKIRIVCHPAIFTCKASRLVYLSDFDIAVTGIVFHTCYYLERIPIVPGGEAGLEAHFGRRRRA